MTRKIQRALISVSDKTGLVEFAKRLAGQAIEIVSTGGTSKLLREAGLEVRDVSDLTGFPEILGGRVKTLHPKVHGGILAIRGDAGHERQVEENAIQYIDMVVVNLYPFTQTVSRPDVTLGEAIENIDIGGPSMIRSSAKNFRDVVVLVDPADYQRVADEMEGQGEVSLRTRFDLARKAFDTTARYDAAISEFLMDSVRLSDTEAALQVSPSEDLPSRFTLFATKSMGLRYGENPHQRAALYVTDRAGSGIARAEQLHGKELSFNNIMDLEAAWALVTEFPETACAIIKHTNPCGAATAGSVADAFQKAKATDPVSAYGGIIGFNRTLTEEAARLIADTFFEAIVAPDYDPAALGVLTSKKNLRIMRMGEGNIQGADYDLKMVGGGLLVQDRDRGVLQDSMIRVVTSRQPTPEEMQAMKFAWILVKHVKSNAIVYAREGQLVGVGAGQMSRVDSARIGAMKAQLPIAGTVLASDAYFPFRDGVDEAAHAGVTAVIQPGGSIRDELVIAAANEHNLTMVFTGMRHFKH